MKKLTSIFAAAAVLVGCQSAEDPADQYRKALPTSETLKIEASGADESTAASALVAKSAINGKSEFAIVSYNFAAGVNGGVGAFLWLVHSITWWQATDCDDDSCTWGPGLGSDGRNYFKLVVTKVGSESYDYVLSGARADTGGTDFLPIVVGHANKGAFAHRGDGQFSVKFDNDAQLAHHALWLQSDFGTLDVRYDTHGELQNQVVWRETKFDDGGKLDAADPTDPARANVYFNFDANQRDLLIAFETLDLPAQFSLPNRTMTLHTQWAASGQGRADVWYTDTAMVDPAFYSVTQCWNGESAIAAESYAQVYDSGDAVNFPDVDACIAAQTGGVVDAFPTLPEPLYP